jgi:putative intracellular protease/amidase
MSVLRRVVSAFRSFLGSTPTRRPRPRLRLEGLEGRDVPCAPCFSPHPGCLPACCAPAPAPAPENPPPPPPSRPLPVLMVIANQDFYYREYADTRASLEAAGVPVAVAAATDTICRPHWNSGQGADGGLVDPDLAVSRADAADYSAVVFVGGWGASSYQYAFAGTYANSAYNPTAETREAVNELVNDFVAQDKYVCGLCHGVSVLAYARVDGHSLLEGRQVATYEGWSPAYSLNGQTYSSQSDRVHIEVNGGTAFRANSIGDPRTAADDVWIDGKIITGQNFDSAARFGQVIAQQVLAG